MWPAYLLHHIQPSAVSSSQRDLVPAQSARAQPDLRHPAVVIRLALRHVPDLVGHVQQQQPRVQPESPRHHRARQVHAHIDRQPDRGQHHRVLAHCALPANALARRPQHRFSRPLVPRHLVLEFLVGL